MDVPERIEYNNNIFYIYSREKYNFQPYECKIIYIYLIFYKKSDKFLYFNLDDRLQSIFNLNQYIFKDDIKNTLSLEIHNKTDKNIIINQNEKLFKISSDYIIQMNKYIKQIDNIKNKNINDLISDKNIELSNNNLLFY